MKKMSFLILALVLLLALTGCASPSQNNDNASGNQVQANNPTTEDGEPNQPNEPQILVAYFSATGNTAGIASEIAAALSADIYEITPETPYTSEDLDYGNSNSRTSLEMNDTNSRPAISGSLENMADYDVVFIGYPIWWGQAPKIICTFIETYDFNGKTIVPFCTSASSDIGSSAVNLQDLTSGANWLEGRRFAGTAGNAGSADNNSITEWLAGLDISLDTE